MGMGIQDGGSQSIGGLGLQWLNRAAFPFPCLRPPTVQQLDPVHSGHLLLDISNSYSHCQETRRGLIRVKPLPRACLVLDNWHRCLCFPLPIVLARAPVAVTPAPNPPNGTSTTAPPTNTTPDPSGQFTTVIDGGACGLVLTANSVMFLTILGFFIAFDSEDVEYSVW